ncbi:MAG: FG-GAP repeat protein, partial [Planctomycetes bacterium]|nr:FG-GAP repeat protein [Planctomycetota bacterium]
IVDRVASGSVSQYAFSRTMEALGDLDGDGAADFAIGDPLALGGGLVRVFSGQSRNLLYSILPIVGGYDCFGACISMIGDLDGDGINDVLVGAPQIGPANQSGTGYIGVYSGVNGSLLFTDSGYSAGDYFGWCVSPIGDIDQDGVAEFAVGAPEIFHLPNPQGYVQIYSGDQLTVIATLPGQVNDRNFGQSIIRLDDYDADGIDDLLIGSPGSASGSGALHAFSGASLTLTQSLYGGQMLGLFGKMMARVGDVNGDGIGDFAVSSPGYSIPGGVFTHEGRVQVFAGDDLSILHSFQGTQLGMRLGEGLSGLGDVDGDLVPDFLMGSQRQGITHAGESIVRSGSTGNILFSWRGDQEVSNLNASVAGAGDINGDGFADFMIRTEDAVLMCSIMGARKYDTSLGGNQVLDLRWRRPPMGPLSAGAIEFDGAQPGSGCAALIGVNPARFSAGGFEILVDVTPGSYFFHTFGYPMTGVFTFPIDLKTPALSGSSLYLQTFAFHTGMPSGLAISNGLELRFKN